MQLYSSRGDILYVNGIVLTAHATFTTLIGSVSIKALIRSKVLYYVERRAMGSSSSCDNELIVIFRGKGATYKYIIPADRPGTSV